MPLREALSEGDGRELFGYLIDATQRMRRLIDVLLTYESIASSAAKPAPTDANLPLHTAIANLQIRIEDIGGTRDLRSFAVHSHE